MNTVLSCLFSLLSAEQRSVSCLAKPYLPILGCLVLGWSPLCFGALSYNYVTTADVPVTANGYAASGTLTVTLSFSLGPGQLLTLVNNTSGSAVSGTFTGLPENALLTISNGGNNFAMRISYAGGDGNDITLTRVAKPGQIGNSSNIYDWSLLAGKAGETGSADGVGTDARFSAPTSVAMDSVGNLFVVDGDNHTVRKITPNGIVSTLAGSPGVRGSSDGLGSVARFDGPFGISCDSHDNLYIADQGNSCIRKITPAGSVSTVAASVAQLAWGPQGVTVDSQGNLYISDTNGPRICKITPQGVFSVLAGQAGQSGSVDGTGSAARFYTPSGIATDASGNVYVADQNNHLLRKITPSGVVTTLAGSSGQAASVDGTGSIARLYYPTGINLDPSGDLFLCGFDASVRRITPSGVVTTVGGKAQQGGTTNGIGDVARFLASIAVASGKNGELYVVESLGGHVIRKGTPMGFKPIVTVAAASMTGSVTLQGTVNPNGFVTSAKFEYGKTQALGSEVVLSLGSNAATSPQAVSAQLSSLEVGSTYYYRLSASNLDGSTSSQLGTVVVVPPLSQPANNGDAATLVVAATGAGPLTYQWQKDGVDIPGATSSTFSLASAKPWHIGDYTVKVTDANGTITSNAATLSLMGVQSGIWKGLTGYYKLDSDASDRSVFGQDLTISGATPNPDRFSQSAGAFSFNGLGNSIYKSGLTGPDASSAQSISVWFKAGFPINDALLAGSAIHGNARFHISIKNGRLEGAHGNDSNFQYHEFGSTTLQSGTWYHAVLTTTGNAGAMNAYLNGVAIGQAPSGTNTALTSNYWIQLGSVASSSFIYNFKGEIDDVRFYNRAISGAEVAALYAAENAPNNWRQTYFGSTSNTGNAADDADPDRDGLKNLLEYALNLPPNAVSRVPASVQATGGNLEYLYDRGTAAFNGGTSYQVEWSDDLTTWSSAGVVETLLSDDGTTQQVKATLPAGSGGRRFVRLRVQ